MSDDATTGSDDGQEPLEEPARRSLFERLAADGAVGEGVFRAAREIIERHLDMRAWLLNSLLVFGLTLVLAGVAFFFAFNWADLSDLAKLGLVQAGIGLCLGGALHLGEDRAPGKLLIVAGAVGIGIYLAVFGLVYQTWAGTWELLLAWMALMVPFIAIARSQVGWLVFATVVAVWLLTGLGEQWGLEGPEWVALRPAVVGVCAACFWGGLLWWSERGAPWLERFWSEYVWCVVVFGSLVVMEGLWVDSPAQQIPFLGLAVATPLLWFGRLRRRFDMGLGVTAGTAWLLVTTFHVGRWLLDTGMDKRLWTLVMAVLLSLATSVMVWGLGRLADRDDDGEGAR